MILYVLLFLNKAIIRIYYKAFSGAYACCATVVFQFLTNVCVDTQSSRSW